MNRNFAHRLRPAFGLATAFTIAAFPGCASAAGVTAGTLIQNIATATFTSGASGGTVQSNTVSVKVDELLDVAVAGLTVAPVPTGSTSAVLSYSVTNTGNGSEAFRILVDPAVAGNQFDATVQTIAIDTNGNSTYDPGIDQILANGTATPAIAADGSLRLFAIVNLPASAADGQNSQIRLAADCVALGIAREQVGGALGALGLFVVIDREEAVGLGLGGGIEAVGGHRAAPGEHARIARVLQSVLDLVGPAHIDPAADQRCHHHHRHGRHRQDIAASVLPQPVPELSHCTHEPHPIRE